MAKGTTIPVRLETGQGESVKQIATACGVGEADVIRWAVEALGDYWRHHGSRLLLPLRFQETFSVVTLPVPNTPMILHEPPRVQSKPSREGERRKMSRSAQ